MQGKANNSGFLQSTVVPTIYHTLYSNPQGKKDVKNRTREPKTYRRRKPKT